MRNGSVGLRAAMAAVVAAEDAGVVLVDSLVSTEEPPDCEVDVLLPAAGVGVLLLLVKSLAAAFVR